MTDKKLTPDHSEFNNPPERRLISREMVLTAARNGWTATDGARHYGFNRTAFAHAAIRFGVQLHKHVSPPGTRKPLPVVASETRVKAWSVSPAAIKRFLNAPRVVR